MNCPDPPTSFLCFENLKIVKLIKKGVRGQSVDLELDSERMLHDPVQTRHTTGAVLVALVDPSEDHIVQPPELVAHVLLDSVVPLTASGLDGELPAGARVLVPAVVSAVAASEELLVRVEVDPGLGEADCGVLHVLGEVPVNRVDTGDGNVLLPVTHILYRTQLPAGFEFVHHVDPPIKVEKVNLQVGVCNPRNAE